MLILTGLVSGWGTSCEALSSETSDTRTFERSFICPVDDCQCSYRRKDHLNRHLLHHQGTLFKCPIENCGKEFTLQSNFNRHSKEAHEGKPLSDAMEQKKCVCKEISCGKEFNYPSQLRTHELSHVKLDSSEAFCAIPSCMKPFANVECLRAHIRSCHQYINCEVCGSKHLKKNIKRHLRSHEERSPEMIKCSFEGCHHSFTTKSNLQQHVKAVHLKLRPFACGMRFAFKHVRDVHEKSTRHVYVHGDIEEFDEQFRSRPRGGRKRNCPTIETLLRKRITLPNNQGDDALDVESSDYLLWLLSAEN